MTIRHCQYALTTIAQLTFNQVVIGSSPIALTKKTI